MTITNTTVLTACSLADQCENDQCECVQDRSRIWVEFSSPCSPGEFGSCMWMDAVKSKAGYLSAGRRPAGQHTTLEALSPACLFSPEQQRSWPKQKGQHHICRKKNRRLFSYFQRPFMSAWTPQCPVDLNKMNESCGVDKYHQAACKLQTCSFIHRNRPANCFIIHITDPELLNGNYKHAKKWKLSLSLAWTEWKQSHCCE